VQATTLPQPVIPDTFVAPGISVAWNYDTSNSVQIKIYDRSNCETGYRIYRGSGVSSPFTLIAELISTNPSQHDTIVYFDSAVAPDAWYWYKVAAYKQSDSIFSVACSTYTLKSQQPQQIPVFTELSTFPISDSNGWTALAGDSIIMHEKNDPAGKFTTINIANPASPLFAGYIDSSILIAYPQQTLIPAYLKFGVSNGYGPTGTHVLGLNNSNTILVVQDSAVQLFDITNNSLSSIATFICSGLTGILLLNDSMIGALYTFSQQVVFQYPDSTANFLYPIKVNKSGFIKHTAIPISINGIFCNIDACYSKSSLSYVRGAHNSIMINGISSSFPLGVSEGGTWIAPQVQIYDTGLKKSVFLGDDVDTITPNSGYYFSPTQFLSMNTNNIYAEDIMDLHAYKTALALNAVLPDSLHSRQSVLVDTVNKRLYIFYPTAMVTYSYSLSPMAVRNGLPLAQLAQIGIKIITDETRSGVTIVLPQNSRRADLFFSDLSGRMVDKMLSITSNAVVWRPKAQAMGCYIVSAKIGEERYTARFMAR